MNKRMNIPLMLCTAVAVFATGCHEPSFETMAPTQQKWSMAVVAQPQDDKQKAQVESLTGDLARTKAMTSQVTWVGKDDATGVLQKYAGQDGMNLIVFLGNAAASNLQALADKQKQVRFTIMGDSNVTGDNVRHLILNRKQLLFEAGYLAAEANKQSYEPFTVLVDKPLASDDPDWQAILEGVRFQGRKDTPLQMTVQDFLPRDTTKPDQKPLLKQTVPVRLTGRSVLLLSSSNVPTDVWNKIRDKDMRIVRTDMSLQPLPLQANVVAQPTLPLDSAVTEEAALLADGKWQGGQTVALPNKHPYRILQNGLFPDKDTDSRLEIIEEELASGTLKPDAFKTE